MANNAAAEPPTQTHWLWVIYGCVPLGLGLDFWSKHWASQQFGGVEWMIRDQIGVFMVRHHGLWAMESAPGDSSAAWVGIAATAALFIWACFTPATQRSLHGALACMMAGALGNTLERLWFGYVTDWLLLRFFPGGLTVNFADLCLTTGCLWLWVAILRTPTKNRNEV